MTFSDYYEKSSVLERITITKSSTMCLNLILLFFKRAIMIYTSYKI